MVRDIQKHERELYYSYWKYNQQDAQWMALRNRMEARRMVVIKTYRKIVNIVEWEISQSFIDWLVKEYA